LLDAKSRQVNWLFRQFRNGSRSGSATGASDEEATGPKLQMSLAAQFSGTVSGSDQFQATLSQLEIQEV
jgi:hypothetical protein